MLEECPFCGSEDLEIVDTVHKCEHIEVLIVICNHCAKDMIDTKYPYKEG